MAVYQAISNKNWKKVLNLCQVDTFSGNIHDLHVPRHLPNRSIDTFELTYVRGGLRGGRWWSGGAWLGCGAFLSRSDSVIVAVGDNPRKDVRIFRRRVSDG